MMAVVVVVVVKRELNFHILLNKPNSEYHSQPKINKGMKPKNYMGPMKYSPLLTLEINFLIYLF